MNLNKFRQSLSQKVTLAAALAVGATILSPSAEAQQDDRTNKELVRKLAENRYFEFPLKQADGIKWGGHQQLFFYPSGANDGGVFCPRPPAGVSVTINEWAECPPDASGYKLVDPSRKLTERITFTPTGARFDRDDKESFLVDSASNANYTTATMRKAPQGMENNNLLKTSPPIFILQPVEVPVRKTQTYTWDQMGVAPIDPVDAPVGISAIKFMDEYRGVFIGISEPHGINGSYMCESDYVKYPGSMAICTDLYAQIAHPAAKGNFTRDASTVLGFSTRATKTQEGNVVFERTFSLPHDVQFEAWITDGLTAQLKPLSYKKLGNKENATSHDISAAEWNRLTGSSVPVQFVNTGSYTITPNTGQPTNPVIPSNPSTVNAEAFLNSVTFPTCVVYNGNEKANCDIDAGASIASGSSRPVVIKNLPSDKKVNLYHKINPQTGMATLDIDPDGAANILQMSVAGTGVPTTGNVVGRNDAGQMISSYLSLPLGQTAPAPVVPVVPSAPELTPEQVALKSIKLEGVAANGTALTVRGDAINGSTRSIEYNLPVGSVAGSPAIVHVYSMGKNQYDLQLGTPAAKNDLTVCAIVVPTYTRPDKNCVGKVANSTVDFTTVREWTAPVAPQPSKQEVYMQNLGKSITCKLYNGDDVSGNNNCAVGTYTSSGLNGKLPVTSPTGTVEFYLKNNGSIIEINAGTVANNAQICVTGAGIPADSCADKRTAYKIIQVNPAITN